MTKENSLIVRVFLFLIIMSHGACAEAQVNNYDCCKLAKAVNFDIDFVRINAKKIIQDNKDECVITLLDTLTARVISNGGGEYFSCLDSLAIVGDGYVSEYFMEIGIRVFYKRFGEFFTYIYNAHEKKSKSALERVMVESVSMQISDSDNAKEMERKINAHIDKEIKKGTFNVKQLQYLSLVRGKIDPDMFN